VGATEEHLLTGRYQLTLKPVEAGAAFVCAVRPKEKGAVPLFGSAEVFAPVLRVLTGAEGRDGGNFSVISFRCFS